VTPDGTAVDLIDVACRFSTADVSGKDFIVDDRATAPLPSLSGSTDACWRDREMIQVSNYSLAFPSEPTQLAALNGHPANGDWKIRVRSNDGNNAGLSSGFGFILAADDPDTAITSGPVSGGQSGSSVSFGFGSPNVAGATFECSLDAAPFTACASPQVLNLRAGIRTFEVRARTLGGVDPTPAQVVWTVTPPQTRITKHPKRRTTKRRATFGFTSTAAGSTFQCKLDRRPWRACTSPERVRVKPGRHVFRVRAIDTAGNRDQTPAKAVWRRTRH